MSRTVSEQATSTKEPAYRGADLRPESRPGARREVEPHPLEGAHWTTPEQQPLEQATRFRPERQRDTAVFSTALPPMGLSGMLRRAAHRIPDHRLTHWLILLVADRLDVLESLPRTLARRPARQMT